MEQMVQLAELLHPNPSVLRTSPLKRGEHRLMEQVIQAFLILINMRKQSIWVKWAWTFRVSEEFKYDCLRGVEWVFQTDYDCTVNKLPVLNTCPSVLRTSPLNGRGLYGPLNECRLLVFLEFIEADMAYLAFRKNFDDVAAREESLDRLVAILYRGRNPRTPLNPQKGGDIGVNTFENWNGDPRCEYNSNVLDYHQEYVKTHVSRGEKYAVLMFYHACHMRWERMFTNIFKKASAESDGSTGGDWAGALKSLAGGSINVDKMSKVNAALALSDLDDRIREAEEVASRV